MTAAKHLGDIRAERQAQIDAFPKWEEMALDTYMLCLPDGGFLYRYVNPDKTSTMVYVRGS